MQSTCAAIIDWTTFTCHLDYWAARYQAAIFAVFALLIAFTQMRISHRLSKITQEQFRMAKAQRETERAVATIAVDKAIVATFGAYERLIGLAGHDTETDSGEWHWRPEQLEAFVDVSFPDDLEALALKAFPDRAANLVQLRDAAMHARDLALEYREQPWVDAVAFPANASPIDYTKTEATDKALNRVLALVSVCAELQPHVRGS